jgi:hypothetical protein
VGLAGRVTAKVLDAIMVTNKHCEGKARCNGLLKKRDYWLQFPTGRPSRPIPRRRPKSEHNGRVLLQYSAAPNVIRVVLVIASPYVANPEVARCRWRPSAIRCASAKAMQLRPKLGLFIWTPVTSSLALLAAI